MSEDKISIRRVIQAMGLVFGDIGTSPIYTLSVIFLTCPVTVSNVIGVLSLIVWTLIAIVSVQYILFEMRQSKQGEGGTIVLKEILRKLLKNSRSVVFFSLLTYLGVSLLIGDSVITPAISILSAVEGLKFVPGIHNITIGTILLVTIFIALWLFSIQKKGTENITKIFGPIMLIWFIALALCGLASVKNYPMIFWAFNPLNGIKFIMHNGLSGFFVLSEVILCATGAEALYADMGHLGKKPIVCAWYFVFCALILNYLGQGVFLLSHPKIDNILFGMIVSQVKILYIPFLAVSLMATIIASQAMISGLFAIVYQAINTRILPLFKINYTSEKINSQIYISVANKFLMILVLIVILFFKSSSALAAAYGFADTGAFNITIILLCTIFFIRKKYFHFTIALCLWVIDLAFLVAAFSKIPTGAYWSIVIAAIPFTLITLYITGQKALYKAINLMDKEEFMQKYSEAYTNSNKIDGQALFFARGIDRVPPYVVQTMFENNILYKENIFVQINKSGEAFGLHYDIEQIADGLKSLKIDVGYMENLRIEKILKALDIDEKAIFYGIEDIETENFFWQAFALIKKVTPAFVNFYNLPVHKVHGVITQIKM